MSAPPPTVPVPNNEDELKTKNPQVLTFSPTQLEADTCSDSLSATKSTKNVQRKQVNVKPPLADVTMGRL